MISPEARVTLPLFRRNLQMVVLASGSKGNATWVGDHTAGVLIDCGISTRQIFARLELLGMVDVPIDAVLVTHEHSDHIGSGRVLCNRLRKRQGRAVPFYMTAGTLAGTHPRCRPDAVEVLRSGERLKVRHLDIESFPVPHDVRDPVGFRVGLDGLWAGVLTDMGRPTALIRERLASLSIAVIEFNHDTDTLLDGPYPWHLKQRIRSSHGHLSNSQASKMLVEAICAKGEQSPLQHVLLGHLSDENNSPALARRACEQGLAEAGALDRVSVTVAEQARPLAPVVIPAW